MILVISRDMQLNLIFGHLRFRVTKVEHKSNSKERKSLMSVTGVEGLNGDVPATPVKQEAKEAPATPVKEGTQERRSSEWTAGMALGRNQWKWKLGNRLRQPVRRKNAVNVSILCENSSGKFESFCKSLQKSYLIIQLMITLVKPKIYWFFF